MRTKEGCRGLNVFGQIWVGFSIPIESTPRPTLPSAVFQCATFQRALNSSELPVCCECRAWAVTSDRSHNSSLFQMEVITLVDHVLIGTVQIFHIRSSYALRNYPSPVRSNGLGVMECCPVGVDHRTGVSLTQLHQGVPTLHFNVWPPDDPSLSWRLNRLLCTIEYNRVWRAR